MGESEREEVGEVGVGDFEGEDVGLGGVFGGVGGAIPFRFPRFPTSVFFGKLGKSFRQVLSKRVLEKWC